MIPIYIVLILFAEQCRQMRGFSLERIFDNSHIFLIADKASKTYKNVRWLLAHTGSNDLEKYIRVGNESEHGYLETCLSLGPRGPIETLVREVPVEKILRGGDQPFMNCTQQIGRGSCVKIYVL